MFQLEEVGNGEDGRIPPHAQLPEDEYEELPVHNAEDRSVFIVIIWIKSFLAINAHKQDILLEHFERTTFMPSVGQQLF